MRTFLAAVGLAAFLTVPALADRGDTWLLQVDHRDNGIGPWNEYPGEGYNGTSAWGHAGTAGDISRIYWKLDHPAVPPSVQLYTIEFFDPAVGGDNWQPIESLLHGTYEDWPIDTHIPWNGYLGQNHQWIQTQGDVGTAGQFVPAGPGPQAPESDDYYAGPSGIYMWLMRGSQVYAKWDFGFYVDRTWSVLRLKQETGAYRADFTDPPDDDVDLGDFATFQACFNGPNRPFGPNCTTSRTDFDFDGDVDLTDFATFQSCFNGPNRPPRCEGMNFE